MRVNEKEASHDSGLLGQHTVQIDTLCHVNKTSLNWKDQTRNVNVLMKEPTGALSRSRQLVINYSV